MILIVGLGNPEKKYENTPHNLGFKVIELFQERFNFPKFTLNENSLISKKEDIILIKPQTYMNNSGTAVKQVSKFYKIPPENIWIVHDENDLEFSKLKINKNITAKGHNGVKSIIEKLGTQDFIRFRIGIKNNLNKDLMDYVLKPFSKEEQEIINETIYECTSALDETIKNGIEQTILKFNTKS